MSNMLPPHLGGHCGVTHTDSGVLDYLCSRYSITSMVDIGCGPGGMRDLAAARGIDWLGIDGDPEVARWNTSILLHDFTQGIVTTAQRDLAWCVEFVEHVEERFAMNFIYALNQCRVLLMSHALPGQPGYHHVNCQDDAYWIALLGVNGWRLSDTDTAWVRNNATDPYIKQSGLVFARERL